MVKLINLKEREEELSKAEIRRIKANYRFHQVSSLVTLGISIPSYALLRKQATSFRGTSDLYGGEMMILLLGIALALAFFPKYSLSSVLPKDTKKVSRHYDTHVDIDIHAKDSSMDCDEGYMFDVVSKNGVYDIIDHDRNHHMVALTKRG